MRAVRLLIGALLVVGLVPAPSVHAVEAATPEPLRILLVGDSVTHGSAGDWTWRYRLWQHFTAAGIAVDFVGPRQDLYDNVTGAHGSMTYADPGFDLDHAARWGMLLDVQDVPIGRLVEDYRPDIVVEMLGVNDLIFDGKSPDLVAQRVAQFVDDARSADPTVDLVLAEATQHWFTSVPEFNAALASLEDLSTEESRVVLARTSVGYARDADTWDTSHPNARGEVRIAAAVADSMHVLGIGPAAVRPLVLPPVGPRTAAVVEAVAGDGAITLTWSGPPGATAQYVWGRDVTAGERWQRLPWPVTGSSWTAYLLTNGHRYEYRLQPVKGDDEPEGRVFSDVVAAVPFRPPAAPVGLRASAGARCAELDWRAPEFATRYTVARRTATGWRLLGSTHRTRFAALRLPRVRVWQFRVRAWHLEVAGQAARIKVPRDPAGGSCR